MIRSGLKKLLAAFGLGAGIQALVISSGFARLTYKERRWSTNPFVIGWLVQLAVLAVALIEAGRQSEREEVREAMEILRH
jgi:hypothetical protein